MPEERIVLGMGAASGLVALFGKPRDHVTTVTTMPLVLDQIDHVALLAAELDIISRRKSLEDRGNPLLLAIQFRRFADLQRTDAIELH